MEISEALERIDLKNIESEKNREGKRKGVVECLGVGEPCASD
jgi:hypothetical protein